MHLAKSPLHVFTAEYGSESTSELRSLGEMEIKARMFSGVRVSSSLDSEVGLGLRKDQKIAAALEL